MTATRTPCTPEADRFLRTVNTPDPPVQPAARRRYWDDTVMEAVGELRRRLNSTRESIVTMALLSVLEVEKTRMRTGRSISGTQVSNVRDDDGSLPKLGPVEVDQPVTPVVARSASERQSRPLAERATTPEPPPAVPVAQVSEPIPPPAAVSPTRERGPLAEADQPTAVEHPTTHVRIPGVTVAFSDRDDDWTRDPDRPPIADWEPDPWQVAEDRRLDKRRALYIEGCGLYPEDEFPDNPAYHRFRDEPRPHPAFQLWLVSQLGTGDDTLPVGVL